MRDKFHHESFAENDTFDLYQSHHNRTKHIDIHFHFIRSEIEAGSINLQSIDTKDNLADILTKALPKAILKDIVQEWEFDLFLLSILASCSGTLLS